MKDKWGGGYYTACWRRIFGAVERRLFKMAEIEYRLETNGEETVEGELNEIFVSGSEERHSR